VGEIPQLAKLRLEEEESWISSEELGTDGSTDDEAPAPCTPYPLPPHRILGRSLTTSGTTRTLKPRPLVRPKSPIIRSRSDGCPPLGPMPSSDDTEEQEDIMLWRPKRGSLKLPHFHATPETSEQMPGTTKSQSSKAEKPDCSKDSHRVAEGRGRLPDLSEVAASVSSITVNSEPNVPLVEKKTKPMQKTRAPVQCSGAADST